MVSKLSWQIEIWCWCNAPTSNIIHRISDIGHQFPSHNDLDGKKGRTGRCDYRDDLSFLNQIPFNPRQFETAPRFKLQ